MLLSTEAAAAQFVSAYTHSWLQGCCFVRLIKADTVPSRGLRGEIKDWLSPLCGWGGGAMKVITVKLKGTAVKTRLSPRNSSQWSHGASLAYQIVKYCPWHQRNRGVINALNQFWITLRGGAPLGCRHYRKLWWQMHGADRKRWSSSSSSFSVLQLTDAASVHGFARTCDFLLAGVNGFISAPCFKNSCSEAAGELHMCSRISLSQNEAACEFNVFLEQGCILVAVMLQKLNIKVVGYCVEPAQGSSEVG